MEIDLLGEEMISRGMKEKKTYFMKDLIRI